MLHFPVLNFLLRPVPLFISLLSILFLGCESSPCIYSEPSGPSFYDAPCLASGSSGISGQMTVREEQFDEHSWKSLVPVNSRGQVGLICAEVSFCEILATFEGIFAGID